MIAKPVSIPMMARYTEGQLVRIRPLRCNRRLGESGVVIHVKLNGQGHTALDKYIVEFEDRDQEEYWSIQLDTALLEE
jgi:hypothetical protein